MIGAALMIDQLQNVGHVQSVVIDLAIEFGPKVLVAIIIIVFGYFAGGWVGRIAQRSLHRFHLEPPLNQLIVRIVRASVLALFTIMALENLGVELLPLIAGLGVAGAGVALAMQGVLGNVMAGLTIIFTRPFHVGDYISIVGNEGTVANISLFTDWREKPRRSGRGWIARSPKDSFPAVKSESTVARCTGARWRWVRRHSLRQSRTATTTRPSSSVFRCRVFPCAAGDWTRP